MISGLGSSSQMSQLFSRLDSKSQGYLEKSDLASAFGAISGGDESAVDEVFAAFDTDSDGKVTESEFASTLSKLQEELDAQFGQMRMQGGMPPPPPAGDEGFTQEELAAQLEEIGDADSDRASLIADVVANFEAADADGDGKVSFQEAMAYKNGGTDDTTAQSEMAAMQGMPPPPPPAGDAGFTLDELESQLAEIGDSDSERAGLIADIVANFEAADSDGDGKVSFREARAYDESQQSSASAASAGTQAASSESQVMMKIMQLMQAYGQADERTSSLLSTLA